MVTRQGDEVTPLPKIVQENPALTNFVQFLDDQFDVDVSDKAVVWANEIAEGENTLPGIIEGVFQSRTGQSAEEFLGSLPDIKENEVGPVLENILSGERTFQDATQKFGEGTAGDGGAGGGTTDDDPGTLSGVLAGGRTVKVSAEGVDRWYQVYEFPPGSKNFISYQFNDREQARKTLGEDFEFVSRRQDWFQDNVIAEAAAEEVIGLEGTFTDYTDQLMREAAQEAGIRDPGLVGRIASNPEMQQIMALAIEGGWENQSKRILAEQRQTNFWKEELYPGIEKLYNRTQEPERAWNQYQQTASSALEALGYEKDADGTFKEHIGRMLENDISAETFAQQTPTFIRATQNAEFAGVLNQWAERELGREIEFNDWFDLVGGEPAPELEAVAERAMLAHRSQEASARIGAGQIERLAERTDLSDQQAQQVFSEFGRNILATDSFRRSKLTRDDALSALAGVDPEGDFTIEEARMEMAKLAKEEGLFDDEKAQFFVGYNQSGQPERPGLTPLSPESA